MKNRYTKKEAAVLRVAVTTALITTFAGSALNIAIPDIEAHFHMGATSVGWIVTTYMLVTSSLSVPMGKLSARIGTGRGLTIGILIFGIMSIAAVFSFSGPMIIAMRAMQGVGGAFIFATNMAILVLTFPAEKSGEALGILTAGTYTGLSLGPVLGGLLNQYFGWRSIFIFMALISAVAFFTAVKHLDWKNEKRAVGLKQDVRGTLMYITGIVLSIYGFSSISEGRYSWIMLGAGAAVLVIFVIVESRTDDPVMEVGIFAHNRVFTLSSITALLNYGATFAISYLISIYLQVVMGYSSQIAGLLLIVQPLMQALFSPKTGKLSDKVPAWKLVTGGMAICVIELFVFSRITVSTPLWLIIVMLMFGGIGFSFFSSPNTNQIMSSVGKGDKTFASAILSTMRTIGQTVSMAIVTVIAGTYLGNVALAAASEDMLIKTMHVSFLVFTLLCIAGVFMSMTRKNASVEK